MVRLGEAEAPDDLAGREPGQEALLLLLGAVRVDRVHDQARLHAHHRPVAAVHALELAGDEPVADVVHPRAAVTLQGRAEHPQLSHLVDDAAIELLVAVRFQDSRHELVLRVGARHVADVSLVLGELVVEVQGVFPSESAVGPGSGHAR